MSDHRVDISDHFAQRAAADFHRRKTVVHTEHDEPFSYQPVAKRVAVAVLIPGHPRSAVNEKYNLSVCRNVLRSGGNVYVERLIIGRKFFVESCSVNKIAVYSRARTRHRVVTSFGYLLRSGTYRIGYLNFGVGYLNGKFPFADRFLGIEIVKVFFAYFRRLYDFAVFVFFQNFRILEIETFAYDEHVFPFVFVRLVAAVDTRRNAQNKRDQHDNDCNAAYDFSGRLHKQTPYVDFFSQILYHANPPL